MVNAAPFLKKEKKSPVLRHRFPLPITEYVVFSSFFFFFFFVVPKTRRNPVLFFLTEGIGERKKERKNGHGKEM
jgi:hypothetical protein